MITRYNIIILLSSKWSIIPPVCPDNDLLSGTGGKHCQKKGWTHKGGQIKSKKTNYSHHHPPIHHGLTPFFLSLTHQSRNDEEEENEEEDEDAGNIEDEIEATLEDEFPLEEDNEDMENEETKEAASERLEMEIAERYMTDETGLATVTVQKHNWGNELDKQMLIIEYYD